VAVTIEFHSADPTGTHIHIDIFHKFSTKRG
jgi:hypothetical protein